MKQANFHTSFELPKCFKKFYQWLQWLNSFGSVLFQKEDDGQIHPVAYKNHATTVYENKLPMLELKVAMILFAMKHFKPYMQDHPCMVYIIILIKYSKPSLISDCMSYDSLNWLITHWTLIQSERRGDTTGI